MNRKVLLSFAVALIAGIAAVVMVNRYLQQKEASIFENMEPVSVIAVKQDIRAGTRLEIGMLGRREMPKRYVHGNAVDPSDVELVVGQVVNYNLSRGDTLLWTDMSAAAAARQLGSLASIITPGERAISISVDSVSGVSGLLMPNDNVDILCTLRSEQTGEDTTITLMQNITVLATGQTLAGRRNEGAGNYSTVTLLVTLTEAEILTFAERKGGLRVVLRNPDDIQTIPDIPRIRFSDLLKEEFRQEVQVKRDRITREKVEIIRGIRRGNE